MSRGKPACRGFPLCLCSVDVIKIRRGSMAALLVNRCRVDIVQPGGEDSRCDIGSNVTCHARQAIDNRTWIRRQAYFMTQHDRWMIDRSYER